MVGGHLEPLAGHPGQHSQILRGEAGQGTGQNGVVGRDYKGIGDSGLVLVASN